MDDGLLDVVMVENVTKAMIPGALVKLMRAAYDRKKPIRAELPVWFMSGSDDPCAPDEAGFRAAIQNFRDRGSRTADGKMYPGLRHEIFNEGAPEVWSDLREKLIAWTK